MGNNNEGYLGGIMGGESRVESGGGGLKSTGILSLEEAGTQVVGDLTLPQLSWGGITGRSVLTEGSAPLAADTFATFDPDKLSTGASLSNNDCTLNDGSTASTRNPTKPSVSSGKYYAEFRSDATNKMLVMVLETDDNYMTSGYYLGDGRRWINNAFDSPGASSGVQGDIIRVALDADRGTVWYALNDVWQLSATAAEIAAGDTSNAFSTGHTGPFRFGVYDKSNSDQGLIATANFGQDATFNGTETPTTTYTDANGLGEFYYQPPAGFVGLYTTTEVSLYEIGHSLDFDGSNDYLTRSQTTPTEPKKWTWSGWVKNQGTGEQVLLAAKTVATNQSLVEFINSRFGVRRWTGSFNDLNTFTTSTYTDSTVWNHFVVAYDSTAQSVEIWVNGQLESLVGGGGGAGTAELPSLNQTISLSDGSENHYVGARGQLSYWFDGQLAENHFIDGQALTASDFGQSVSGAWYPKPYSGTYGNNGFYLDFADNSTTAALGNDVSGNGNDFTVNNMTTGDQTTDVPAAAPGVPGTPDTLVNTGIFTLEEIYELNKST